MAALARALQALGLKRGDRVMLVSENRPEFCISDLAIMAAGCITVPTYTTNTERDHQHIIENSGACAIIVSNTRLARVLLPAAIRSSSARMVIGIDDVRAGQPGTMDFHDWRSLIAEHPTEPATIAAAARFRREELACIIYTSGTGGSPRGVMQHHGSILANVEGCASLIAEDFGWEDEVFLSFLPLSHAYEHTGGQHFPIALGAQIYYSEGLEKLASNIEEVRPTIMVVGAAAVRGAAHADRQDGGEAGAVRDLSARPRHRDRPAPRGGQAGAARRADEPAAGRDAAAAAGEALRRADQGAGLGRRAAQSRGWGLLPVARAHLPPGLWPDRGGPVISCNRPKVGLKMDTVGPPIEGCEVRIADDGEILVRGELVMHGYWRNEEETARVLKNGWLHTGDIGLIDAKGRIQITDRKKDIIVNDKGDNVAPQKIEGMLTLQPEVVQAMIAGDRRPYMTAVLVPDPEWTQEWCAASGAKCDFKELAHDPITGRRWDRRSSG